MTSFKRTELLSRPHSSKDGGNYGDWGPWKQPVTIQEYGAINKLDFNPEAPYLIAVTSYSKVSLYNPLVKDVHKKISFKVETFGARFRKDGKLLSVGATDGQVKVYDVATKTLLRIFKGHHRAATHRSDFLPDNTHVVSFSDDKSVGLWDLASETLVSCFDKHTDYVRCGSRANVNTDLFVSGSYDRTVLLWDRRMREPALTFTHEDPIEDVVVLPGDGLLVSAAGNGVHIWDIAGGGRNLQRIRPHHKTVTCLAVADGGSSVVSGSLDRHVKRIDMTGFQVKGSLNFPCSLVSVAVDVQDKFVVGGMIDGLAQIFQKTQETCDDGGLRLDSKRMQKTQSHRYLDFTHYSPADSDVIVGGQSDKKVELKHDTFLRKYEYTKALDVTLKPFLQRKLPHYAHSVFYELMRRDGLRIALAGRDERSVANILNYLKKYLVDPRFSHVLLYVFDIVIELYMPMSSHSNELTRLFRDLQNKVTKELTVVKSITTLQGQIELIMSSANAGSHSVRIENQLFPQKTS